MKELLNRYGKTEFLTVLAAFASCLAAPKMGIPESVMDTMIMSFSGIAAAYAGARGWEKSAKAKK